jgi:hypothetical protein
MEEAHGIKVDWLFTECGPYEAAEEGWRSSKCLGFDRDLYIESMRQWIRDVQQTAAYKEGRTKGFALFTTGRAGSVWRTFWTEQPELNQLANMISQEWHPGTAPIPPPPPPEPEPECRGLPRIQYARKYHVLAMDMGEARVNAVFDLAKKEKNTVGWSYDDAGLGDLDNRTAVLWNLPDELHTEFLAWFRKFYPGVTVTFRHMP